MENKFKTVEEIKNYIGEENYNSKIGVMENKEIKIISGQLGVGMRVLCNLPPEELRARKKEVIKNFLDNFNPEIDFKLDGIGTEPKQSNELSGYWSYFITIN